MQTKLDLREFRPELLSRRGEGIAWLSALLVGAAWLILSASGRPVFRGILFLEVFLLLSALSISLGNWMDRRTMIRLSSAGIAFQNGLRKVELNWKDISQVRVFPSKWGKKVEVIGDRTHFAFRTLGEVKVQGELKGRLGFLKGEEIFREIIQNGNLHPVDQSGQGYYYVRK